MKNKIRNTLLVLVGIVSALALCHLFANIFIPFIRSMHGL